MNTTLLVICILVVLYLGASVRQWRRLSRKDEGKTDGPVPPRPLR